MAGKEFSLDRIFPLLLILLLTLIYFPVFGVYAHTDSYEFFWNAKRNPIFHHVFIQGGRPIFGFLLTKLFQWTDTISDLKYIRLVSFVGNALLLLVFYSFLIRNDFSKLAVALTVFFSCSSFMCLAMSWTATFQIGWAMLVALAGAQLCLKAVDTNSSTGRKIINLAGAIAAGLVSLMLYQPSFTFFILIIFLSFERHRNVPVFIKGTAIYLLIFVVYFFLFKWMLWYTGLPPLGRSSDINLDVFGKVSWFLDTALVHSMRFNLHLVRNSFVNMFRVPVALLFLFCIIRFFRWEGINRQTIIYVALIIALYFLAYIPNLISLENHASNRSMGTVVLLNSYFLYKGLLYLIRPERIQSIAVSLVTLLFCVFGYSNLRWGVTKIHSAEYAIMKNATRDILMSDPSHSIRKINIIRPSRQFLEEQGIVQRESGGEIGLLSNSVEWATLPMFLAIIEELSKKSGHDPAAITLNICNSTERQDCLSEGPVVDVGKEFMKYYLSN